MNQFPLSNKQKVPFVCFACRIGLKTTIPFYYEEYGGERRPEWANPKCPRCKKPTVYLGRYFKIPSQSALNQWRKAELLWRSGWIANGFSCAPKTLRDAREFVRIPEPKVVRLLAKRRAEEEERLHQRAIKRSFLRFNKVA